MVDQLNAFAAEVTRVAREVGTDGKLGGQAEVKGVAGVWKDLTDNVNTMASNLTNQVRGIASVVTAVANGDLRHKLTLDAKGEIAELANTINSMTGTLAVFADQVTSVAREVGVEGRLGGQARVPGAAGTWRDLTDNVNQLSATLTTQVRAIAEVATAVTKGDLTRSIGVEASGEVAALKDNINEMIGNLKATTEKNAEQDWLKTNLARFTRMLQGQRDPMTVSKLILSELAPLVNAVHGTFYGVVRPVAGEPRLVLQAGYAYKKRDDLPAEFGLGEGLVGQCAVEKQRILVTDVPSDYMRVNFSIGEAKPFNIIVLPVLFEGDVRAVIELASFQKFSPVHLDFLGQLTESIGIVMNTIEANSRTEDLLRQSQSLANELQSQNAEIEQRRAEVETAKKLVEEKAEQLALASRYKSEFLANMSHELRTPLNSLLILAKELSDNPERNLLPRQVEYANIIRSSGTDLLHLISDILDLSKIESGAVELEVTEWPLAELPPLLDRTFQHVAASKKLRFTIHLEPDLPETIFTDPQRLQQVLNNLLSNAFKFTESGRVQLTVSHALSGWDPTHTSLNRAEAVIALSVSDTGIGIPTEKQQLIFEAFKQVDGTISRKYGGTGLGLSICRELAHLLGGEITLESEPGRGSTFTMYLPVAIPVIARTSAPETAPSSGADGHRQAQPRLTISDGPWAVESGLSRGQGTERDGHPNSVLVVGDDMSHETSVTTLLEPINVQTIAVASSEAALAALQRQPFGCLVVDVRRTGAMGWQLIDKLSTSRYLKATPVFAYTGGVVTPAQQARLSSLAGATKVRNIKTAGRLRDEVLGVFHQLRSKAAATDSSPIETVASLAGKKILVVDDDVRNIFALTAMLERQQMTVVAMESGQEAIDALRNDSNIDIALVDIMMPEMDGYVTIRKMRELKTFKERPIIALTAKAMAGDREKCIEAGASDYVAKPVNTSHLLALLDTWLSKGDAVGV
jgi:signal transduction histidine kinase/CheY-like chemotaxis protein/HAMP domain-containing protein